MRADAEDGPLAVDLETAARQSEISQLKALTVERAVASGSLAALKKVRATPAEIAARKADLKLINAKVQYAASAALDPNRGRIRLAQLYGGGSRVAVIDLFRTGEGVLRRLDGAHAVMHNAAFDLSFLETLGVEFDEIHDTMQAARLTLGERSMSLEAAVESHLGIKLDKHNKRVTGPLPTCPKSRCAMPRRTSSSCGG